MKTLATGYAYLFYFFYNSLNKVKGNILVQWKAVFMVLAVEMLILTSAFYYGVSIYKFDISENFNKFYLLILVLLLVGLKLWFFERNQNWRQYIEEFNAWSEEKKSKWNRIMRVIVALVFANLILSVYWMSQIDWSEYR